MVANHIARRVGDAVQQRIDHLGIGQKMQDLPEELWHKSFRYYVKEDPDRKGGPNLRLLRLDPNKPSPTITGYVFNKFVHPNENRYITVREAARLQGFPDSVIFAGTLTSTQLQVGNAVPVPLAKAVFESLLCSASQHGFDTTSITALSLFSGAGGLDIGAEQAIHKGLRVNTKVALDIWGDACKTLQGHFASRVRVVREDITKVKEPVQFWQEIAGVKNNPDIIFGGPPCQSFSQAGKQQGMLDERGQLVFEFLRFVHDLYPPYFIMENVANLKGVGGGKLYQHILEKMDELGYNVSVGVLLAAEFGAPQLRNRLLFMGGRKDIGHLHLPISKYSKYDTLFDEPFNTVGQAFEGLPQAEFSHSRLKNIAVANSNIG